MVRHAQTIRQLLPTNCWVFWPILWGWRLKGQTVQIWCRLFRRCVFSIISIFITSNESYWVIKMLLHYFFTLWKNVKQRSSYVDRSCRLAPLYWCLFSRRYVLIGGWCKSSGAKNFPKLNGKREATIPR